MNKPEIITSISEKSGLTKKDSEKALDAFVKTVEEGLSEGKKIKLVGFGSFQVKDRKARKGRNPRKPDQVFEIPPYKAPVFKAGKTLKDKVNE